MDLVLGLGRTALELGLICSITTLSLFLSYSMLNVCDLSTDGCFTLGAAVGAVFVIAGHPWLSIPAAMLAGLLSGLLTAVLQTRLGIDSLLSGIVVNTGLYSLNIAIMGGASLLNMNKMMTVFTAAKTVFDDWFKVAVGLFFSAAVALVICLFLRTRLGIAIRATGNNLEMVKASSINPAFTTTVGLCVSGAFTALSGCLLAQSQKSVSIDIGSGMVTVALASLLIGNALFGNKSLGLRAFGVILGSFIFRLGYTIALRLNMPAYMLKAVSSIIVIIAISGPYLKQKNPELKRRLQAKGGQHA